jgi:hypothetical protein
MMNMKKTQLEILFYGRLIIQKMIEKIFGKKNLKVLVSISNERGYPKGEGLLN